MTMIILLSLLATGLLAGSLFDLFDNGDDPASPETPGEEETIQGGPGDDLLIGDATDDTINGGAGDDTIDGGDGTNLMSGNGGDDDLNGGSGVDAGFGGEGDDRIAGGGGDDIAFGGAGDDTLLGGPGDDLLVGGSGADLMKGSTGNDVLVGVDTGTDGLDGPGFVTALGALLEDNPDAELTDLFTLPGAGGDTDSGDLMEGGYGDDAFAIGSDDTAVGGAGADAFGLADWIADGHAATIADYDATEDQISYSHDGSGPAPVITVEADTNGDALVMADGVLHARVVGAAATLAAGDIVVLARDATGGGGGSGGGGLTTFSGTELADDITGTEGNDGIRSLGGGDILTALGGNDYIHSGLGSDHVDAGAGNDRVFGNDDNDTILGGTGDDFLRGGHGADVIIDTAGNDAIIGDSGNDSIIASNLGNAAALETAVNGAPATASMSDVVGGLTIAAGSDSDAGDVVYGGRGHDSIVFGTNDLVFGESGNDEFVTGDWIAVGESATVGDFEIGTDTLVYSHQMGMAPVLTISYATGATETTGDAIVSADGAEVLVVRGVGTAFTLADVTLLERAA